MKFENGQIFYEVRRTESISMSDAMRLFIGKMAAQSMSNKLEAIKLLRSEYSLGLKEAKEIVEGIVSYCGPVNLGEILREKLDRY